MSEDHFKRDAMQGIVELFSGHILLLQITFGDLNDYYVKSGSILSLSVRLCI